MSRRLVFRPWLAAAVGIVAVVGLSGVVMVHRFDETHGSMMRERFAVVLRGLASGIERELSFGLPLANQPAVPAALMRAAEAHPEIVLIEVFGVDGSVAYSTETSFVGDIIADAWQEQWQSRDGDDWGVSEGTRQTVGRSLTGEEGTVEGGIGLTYETPWAGGIRPETWRSLLFSALAVIASALLVAGLAIAWLMAPADRALRAVAAGVRRLRSGTGGAGAGPEPSAVVDAETARCLATAAHALQAIETAHAAVHALDREP